MSIALKCVKTAITNNKLSIARDTEARRTQYQVEKAILRYKEAETQESNVNQLHAKKVNRRWRGLHIM